MATTRKLESSSSSAFDASVPSYETGLRAVLNGLHAPSDVGRKAHELVAVVARSLDIRPTDTLRQVISSIRTVLLERTTREDYLRLARLHGAMCTGLLSATPSYIRDPAICTSVGNTLTSRQLVHYQVLEVVRDTWREERGKRIGTGQETPLAVTDTSLRRVTLCAFVDELWCLQAVTDRILYDYMDLLCVTTGGDLDLEATCLCRILLRRGRRLWQQVKSRELLTALYMRLSGLKQHPGTSATLLQMLTKLEDLQRRGWKDVSEPLPTALAGWKTDPIFRDVRSRLGQIAREHVAARWRALGRSPAFSETSTQEPLVIQQLGGQLSAAVSLPALDSKVDVRRSLRAVLLQLSWEELDPVLVDLVRWASRCDGKEFPVHRFIAALYEDAKSSPFWEPLYGAVTSQLQRVFVRHADTWTCIAALQVDIDDSDYDGNRDYDGIAGADTAQIKRVIGALTGKNFDLISDLIIERANESEGERDARTLVAVVRIIFETATSDESRSHLYARLCRMMMEQISDGVMDEGIRNAEGNPVKGGLLFRKYLLNRCQEDFERGWSVQAQTATAAKAKAEDDAAKKKSNTAQTDEEMYSDEYYAAQKAKRRGLGLVRFIGELFKLQMLTERIMHECIKKLFNNVDNPGEEEIESICKLLSTVGRALDTTKARSHMDIYFKRMRDLSDSPNIDSRMRLMLQDVIELRERKWIPRNATAAPTMLSAVHDQAAKERAAAEKESAARVSTMSRGGSRRGDNRSDYGSHTGADGWSTPASRAQASKAGDLSQFGKISKTVAALGRSSVFAGKKVGADEREHTAALLRPTSMNPFAALTQNPGEDITNTPGISRSRKPGVDFSLFGMSDGGRRKELDMLPRLKPLHGVSVMPKATETSELSEAQIKKQIEEDTKEFFAIRKPDESEQYFESLPEDQRHRLVDAVFSKALEGKDAEATLAGSLFARVLEKGKLNADILEKGFAGTIEFLDDIAVDAPAAYALTAKVLHLSKFDEARVQRLGEKIAVDGDPLVAPKDKLLSAFNRLLQTGDVTMPALSMPRTPALCTEAPRKMDVRSLFIMNRALSAQNQTNTTPNLR